MKRKKIKFAISIWSCFAGLSMAWGFDAQYPEISLIPVETGQKEVVLIVEGGPYETTSGGMVSQLEWLSELKRLGAHATFFLQGSSCTNDPTIVNRILGEGSRVGNFTQDGTDLSGASNKSNVEAQILPFQELVKETSGNAPEFFRFPGYASNNIVFEVLVENDMVACAADIETDGLSSDPATRAQEVMNNVIPGSIVAMSAGTIDFAMLEHLIPMLQSDGYRFAFPRLGSHSSVQSIQQIFPSWSPTTSLDLNNTPRHDTTGTGFTWKGRKASSKSMSLNDKGIKIDRATKDTYFYTIFDTTGGTQPTTAIDLSGSDALLIMDNSTLPSNIDLHLMVFDGNEWFLSVAPIHLSDRNDNRNWLAISESTWNKIDQSNDLITKLTNTSNLPLLTASTAGTPALQHVEGMGIYFANSTSKAPFFFEIDLYRNRPAASVDMTSENARPLSREMFGIAMTATQESCIDSDVLSGLSHWCELLRWPCGAGIETMNLHGTNLQLTNTAAWISTVRSNVSENLSIIVGAPMSLGMDFNDPDPGYPDYGIMNPTNFSPGLAKWPPDWGGTIPRGVDYSTNLSHYLNIDASAGWGSNLPQSTPPSIQYFEVGNEGDLIIKKRHDRLGRPKPSTELIMKYYNPVFIEYATALHLATPDTKVLGPSTIQFDQRPMLGWFMKSAATNLVDEISLHRYDNDIYEWQRDARFIRDMAWRYGNDTDRRRKDQIGMAYTEWNSEDDDATVWEKGIFIAEVVSKLIANNVDLATCWHVTMYNGRTFYKKNMEGRYAPLPSDYAMKFMRQHIDFSQSPRPATVTAGSNSVDFCAVSQNDGLVLFAINQSETEVTPFSLHICGHVEETATIDTMSRGWNGEWQIGVTNRQTMNIMENGILSWNCPPLSIVAIKLPLSTNRPPRIASDAFDVVRNRTTELNTRKNDTDSDGDEISIVTYSAPNHGTLNIQDGTLRYTPDAGYTGNDDFFYRITDGVFTSAFASVTINVTPNHAPIATDDNTGTTKGRAFIMNPLANDTDPDGDTLSIANITAPFHGTATTNSLGQIEYTPNSGYVGSDTFSYAVQDIDGALSEFALVRILIDDEDLSFDASDDSYIYKKDPDKTYGNRPTLEVRTDTSKYARAIYLQFSVSGLLASDVIESAALEVKGKQLDSDLIAYSVPDNAWTEANLTWNNAPTAQTNAEGTGSGLSGEWVHIPLDTSLFTSNGNYSFRIEAQKGGYYTCYSSDGGATPRLLLVRQRTADADEDGIQDEWEIQQTGNLTTLSESGDYDSDGISDWEEFIIDTDPTVTSAPLAGTLLYDSISGATISLNNSRTNRLYIYEYCTNLMTGQWKQLHKPKKGNGGQLSVQDADASGETKSFYRIRATAP